MKKNIKKKNEKESLKIKLYISSILFFIIAILMNDTLIIRLILTILSMIEMITAILLNEKELKKKFPICIISVFISYIVIDTIVVITINRIPIFSYNIITSNNVRIYNSLGTRVWQCDKNDYKNVKVDLFNSHGYMCSIDDIPTLESNAFINSVIENYDEYKNQYVKIKGKISKKQGQSYIEMKAYKNEDVTINGYVTFSDDITLRIMFKEQNKMIDEYDVFDEITIVGIVSYLETKNNNNVIYITDGEIKSSLDLKEYEIKINDQTKCEEERIIYSNNKYSLYSYCIEDIIIDFKNENAYELSSVLSSNKIALSEFYNNAKKTEKDSMILYENDNYNILYCNDSKIIIGNKNLSFENNTCNK